MSEGGPAPLGLIGGSGLYRLPGLEGGEWRRIETPWGDPSDDLLFGAIGGQPVVFLPRHGRGHRIAPDEINYRANIAAFKIAGCRSLLSISAVGGFRDDAPPGTFVLVDQFVDRTTRGGRSFFGNGIVAHVGMGHPTSPRLGALVADALAALALPHRRTGTMLVIEGPQFSTRAESLLNKAAGIDVIGMTAMPEARLAREAELAYQTVAMVTDFDAWANAHVDVAEVVRVLHDNAEKAQALVVEVAKRMAAAGAQPPEDCERALDTAIITPREHWPAEAAARLERIAPRLFA